MGFWWLLPGLFVLIGCATVQTPPPPLELPEMPPVTAAPPALVMPPEPQPLPLPTIERSATPVTVITRANDAALVNPTADDFSRAIMVFKFRPGALYRIDTALAMPTDIILQPGERIHVFSVGDERWQHKSAEDVDPQHIVIRPTREKLRNRAVIVTTLGSYHLDLRSNETTGLVAVSWRHPEKPQPAMRDGVFGVGYGVCAFAPDCQRGEYLPWKPIYAWDDQTHTYLLFGESMRHTEAPIVYVGTGESRQLVNYRPLMQDRVYKIDRLFDTAELRVNNDKGKAITLAKTQEYRYIRCPGSDECAVIQRWTRRTVKVLNATE